MNSVTISGPGAITGEQVIDGQTQWEWTFLVDVNGQVGVFSVWCDTNDPADNSAIAADVINFLESDPNADGDLGGIASNDPGTDPGDGPGIGGDDFGDFGDDDGALAGNDGGDSGDSGDSA
jgi:hypothetical protein